MAALDLSHKSQNMNNLQSKDAESFQTTKFQRYRGIGKNHILCEGVLSGIPLMIA